MPTQHRYSSRFNVFAKFIVPFAALILLVFILPSKAIAASTTLSKSSSEQVLTVGVCALSPFAMKNKDGSWDGISITLWEHIATQLGYKYKFKQVEFSKLLSGLQDGSLDVVVSPMTITAARDKKVDFTQPYFVTGLGIAVTNRKDWFVTIEPFFSLDFLQAIGSLAAVLLGCGMLVWIIERWYNKEEFSEEAGTGFLASIWWVSITMTTGGYGDKRPASFSGRIIGIAWMFASVVIISSFIASVTASLAVNKIQGPVHGKKDLSRVRVATVENTTSVQFLKENHLVFSAYNTLNKSLASLKHGYVDAVVYDAPLLRYKVRTKYHGSLHVLHQTFYNQYYGVALPLNSNLRGPINQVVLKYTNSYDWDGVLQQYLGRY